MLWDHRPGQNRFAGIVLQEYSVKERKLIGRPRNIFKGTPIGFTEGPHLYKRNGWYYLLTAEGGTGWGHAVTLARSRKLDGPYELHPDVLYPDRPEPAGLRITAHGPRRPGRDADRRDVHGVSVRPAIAQPGALHAGQGNGHPTDGLGRGRVVAHDGRPGDSADGAGAPALPPHLFPRTWSARISTSRGCRWRFNGCARRGRRNCSA